MKYVPDNAPTKLCSRCKVEYPATLEFFYRHGQHGLQYWCKQCGNQKNREWKLQHPQRVRNTLRESRQRKLNEDEKAQREKENTKNRAHRAQIRQELISAYGGTCECCGETCPELLTLEHTRRDGKVHRKVGGGLGTYLDLRRQGYPRTHFKLLCIACNWATRNGAPCPHQVKNLQLSPHPLTQAQQRRLRLKQEMLQAYGQICKCCGEDLPELLTLEHLFHNGKEHRTRVGAWNVIRDLQLRGWPQEGYTTLCFSCNWGSRYSHQCPHELHCLSSQQL